MKVKWTVSFHDEFDSEFGVLSEAVQDEMLAHARLLEQFGRENRAALASPLSTFGSNS